MLEFFNLPILINHYLILSSLIFTALIRTLIGLVPAILLTSPLFGFSIFKLGLPLLLLFLCLILYNLQASIYHKYFDPLLLFIFLFLITNNKITNQKIFFDIVKKYYLFYLIFLGISFYKVTFL